MSGHGLATRCRYEAKLAPTWLFKSRVVHSPSVIDSAGSVEVRSGHGRSTLEISLGSFVGGSDTFPHGASPQSSYTPLLHNPFGYALIVGEGQPFGAGPRARPTRTVAVLLDGDPVRRHLRQALGRSPVEEDLLEFSRRCVRHSEEDLFRIYFYDCPPYDRAETNPLTKRTEDFANSPLSIKRRAFLEKLSRSNGIAFRRGELSFKGWRFSKRATEDLIKHPRPILPEDIEPDFEQKRVDIKIGLDVAWLSSKRIVDRILLVTADSAFIPAMKFARREGVQVVLIRLDLPMKQEMFEHADEVRAAPPPHEARQPEGSM